MSSLTRINYDGLPDLELARLIAGRDAGAVRAITTHNNQRLFRVAFAILKNRADAEDAVQSGYLKAFAAIGGFLGASALSTWLTRIVINEALERRCRRERETAQAGDQVVMIDTYREKLMAGSTADPAEALMAREQIRNLLEKAIARLPEDFRLVFVLREIEGVSVEEAAQVLGIAPATVKTRALRARRRLQDDLGPELRLALEGTFPFLGSACETLSERVVAAWCGPTREP